ncbi:unnamed protein product, partial [Notodromas monacha]
MKAPLRGGRGIKAVAKSAGVCQKIQSLRQGGKLKSCVDVITAEAVAVKVSNENKTASTISVICSNPIPIFNVHGK